MIILGSSPSLLIRLTTSISVSLALLVQLAVLWQCDGSGAVIEEASLQMDQNLNSFEFWN